MAEFASPVRAVDCAADCQRTAEQFAGELPAAERIRFRMGLHIGDVIVEDAACFGDEVNIAARLQELCVQGSSSYQMPFSVTCLASRTFASARLAHCG